MKYHIVSMPRTGSSYLRRTIRLYICNGNEECNINEPFNNENFESKKDKVSYFLNLNEKIKKQENVVVKNHYSQLLHLKMNNPEFYNQFITNSFFNIFLLRKNFFESTLSHAIAKKTSVWGDDEPLEAIVNLTEKEFESSMNWYKNLWIMVAENVLNIPVDKVVYYEDLTFLPDIDFLNITGNAVEFIRDDITTKSYDKQAIVKNYLKFKDMSVNFLSNFHHSLISNKNGEITLK